MNKSSKLDAFKSKLDSYRPLNTHRTTVVMKNWTIHLILRVIIICIIFFILLGVLSGDGSNDAMGNALESAFAMVIAFSISLAGAIVFLGREYVQLSRKNETTKATCNIIIIIVMLFIPVVMMITG